MIVWREGSIHRLLGRWRVAFEFSFPERSITPSTAVITAGTFSRLPAPIFTSHSPRRFRIWTMACTGSRPRSRFGSSDSVQNGRESNGVCLEWRFRRMGV